MCQDLMLIIIHACIYSTSNDYVIVSPFLINCKDMALYTEWNYQFDLMSRWTKYTVPRWYLYVLHTLKTITIISKWEDFILKNLYSAHEDLQRPGYQTNRFSWELPKIYVICIEGILVSTWAAFKIIAASLAARL